MRTSSTCSGVVSQQYRNLLNIIGKRNVKIDIETNNWQLESPDRITELMFQHEGQKQLEASTSKITWLKTERNRVEPCPAKLFPANNK